MILALILMLLDAPRGTPLQGPALEQRTQEIASGLRCPVCQGLSIADSPSEMAVNMKAEVRSMVAKGYTREQIETYFVRSYGEFVLLEPKFQGVTALVWILPVAALLLGAFAVWRVLRRWTATPQSKPRVSTDDPDNDPVTYTATQPFCGTVSELGDGLFEYTPNARAVFGFVDHFAVTADDGHGGVVTKTVALTV